MSHLKNFSHTTAAVAYDVLLHARHEYYVRHGVTTFTDTQYDLLEKDAVRRWPWMGQALGVGSDDPDSYPAYIIQSRRPCKHEREARDRHLERFSMEDDFWS